MAKDIEKKTGTFKSFDGTPIYYEVRGTGRPVVMCYGLACLINHWIHQIKYFSQEYQTIVFDYRGHHQSGSPENSENLTLDAICEDMRALLVHLNIPSASFWGHSLGVQILLRYFELYPETIDNMVFINGFARNPIKGMFGGNIASDIFEFFKASYTNFPGFVGKLWRNAVTNPLAIPIASVTGGFNLNLTSLKDIEVYANGVAALDIDVFLTLFEQMMDYDGTSVLERIDKPVLIISGSKDGLTPMEKQQEMHALIRGSQFLRVPYGSHCTQLDLPDFVNLRIEKFLTDIHYTGNPKSRIAAAPLRKNSTKKKPRDL